MEVTAGHRWFVLRCLLPAACCLLLLVPARADKIPDWLPKYDLDINLDVARRFVTARERVTFTNRHARPTNELVFSAYSRYKIPDKDVVLLAKTLELLRSAPSDGIDFQGHRLEIARVTTGDGQANLPYSWREDMHTALVVQLPKPVAQGESVTVEIEFAVTLPDKEGRWGHRQGITYLNYWYPVLAYYDDQGWQPTPFVAWHQPFFNEAGVYSARLTCPADQKVACSGTVHAVDDAGPGLKRLSIVGCCCREFTLVCSNRFTEWTGQAEHTRVHVFALPEHAAIAEKALEVACEVIPIYNRWFGPYPYEDFCIAESHFAWNGNECSGLVMIDERVMSMPHLMAAYIDHLVSHETLHQWWYNVVGTNGYCETFMDEGVACYFTAKRLQRKYGRNAPMMQYPMGQSWLPNVQHETYRFYGLYGTLARQEQTKTVQPLEDFGNLVTLFSMTYDRGGKILGMVEERIGEAAFFDFMHIVYSKYQFRILRVADFQRELEAYTGYSWEEFFQNWFYRVGATDWAVKKVESKRVEGGVQRGGYRVSVLLEQRGQFTEPTTLGVKFTKDGPYDLRVPVCLGEMTVAAEVGGAAAQVETLPDGKSMLVTLDLPREPVQISVDPDQVLMDCDLSNNHWKCEVNWKFTPLLTPLEETDLTTAYDRWNITTGPWLGMTRPEFGHRTYAGVRSAAYRLQEFTGGTYVAFDGEDRDLRVGADALLLHWPWCKTEVGLQFDHSLTPDWADLRRDRGRVFGRYIMHETPSLYLDPIEYVEVYARMEQEFERDMRVTPPGILNMDDFAGIGIRYYRNYLTPYWDPEGGYKLDLNLEHGLPIIGNYSYYERVQGEFALVKAMPEGMGYMSQTRLAARVYAGYGLPTNAWLFQLGGADRFRGMNRDDREGNAVWVTSLEWRMPLWKDANCDCLDHCCRLRNLYGVLFYDVGCIYLDSHSVGPVAHAIGGGLRFDLALMSFIERLTLRFDAAKMIGDDQSMQFWFGLSQAF